MKQIRIMLSVNNVTCFCLLRQKINTSSGKLHRLVKCLLLVVVCFLVILFFGSFFAYDINCSAHPAKTLVCFSASYLQQCLRNTTSLSNTRLTPNPKEVNIDTLWISISYHMRCDSVKCFQMCAVSHHPKLDRFNFQKWWIISAALH